MLLVRAAQSADAPSLARIHVSAWQVGYRGIMPNDFLDTLSVSERETMWRQTLERVSGDRTILVAEDDGTVVGFAGGGPALRPPDHGVLELYVLNVDPQHWRNGAGGALLDAFVAWTLGRNARELVLWVAKENAHARAFYEHRGWFWDGAIEDNDALGAHVTEYRYRKTIDRSPL